MASLTARPQMVVVPLEYPRVSATEPTDLNGSIIVSDSSTSNSSRQPFLPQPIGARILHPDAWRHQLQAVAFDMDGLLVNTEELYTEVGVTLLGRRGKHFTSALKNAMTGLPGAKAFALMIERENLSDSIDELSQESAEIFAGLLPTRVKTMIGALELLDHLDACGLPRCVATSSSRRFAREVLEIVDIASRFDFVVTSEDVANGKPAPDIYQLAARRMDVETHHMLVLEDSHHGSTAGLSSGACTIAVPGPHSVHHDFGQAYYRANTLSDPQIVQILGAGTSQ